MNSTLTFFHAFLLVLLVPTTLFSQSNTDHKVTLIEKTNDKRLELYAKNIDTISYVVFLRVTTDDYRRSSNRPVLKHINPNSEAHLLTLIKLADTDGKYEKQFIVNEVSNKLEFRKDGDDFQINFDGALKTQNITLFESDNCAICDASKTLLKKYKIAYKSKHIITDIDELKAELKQARKPVNALNEEELIIKIDSKIYTGIKTKQDVLKALKRHIE